MATRSEEPLISRVAPLDVVVVELPVWLVGIFMQANRARASYVLGGGGGG